MHIAQFILTTAILWAFLLPQPAVSGDMLVCLGPAYEDRSEVEAYAAQIAADGDSTRLGISSAGTPGQRNFDDQQVTIQFATNSSGVKMVAFSDDGVTITIRDLTAGTPATTVLSNKGVGQALPNLGQSLHDINFTFLPQHTYEITVDYLNTYYTGEGDVDGAQLIAYGGAIAATPILDRIIVAGSFPGDLGPVELTLGGSISLEAIPGPVGASFPAGEPHWQMASKPPTSQLPAPASGSDIANLTPDALGDYVIEATCGPSSATFSISVVSPILDLDVDSNNDGSIAESNVDSEDLYEASSPGHVLPIDTISVAKLKCTYTSGTLTLSSTFDAAVLPLGSPTTWDLTAGETPPIGLPLIPRTNGVLNQYSPLNLDEPTLAGSLTATITNLDGTSISDTAAVTLVRTVSRSPQNNHAAAWNGGFEFTAAGPQAMGYTTENGFDWTHYGNKAAFPTEIPSNYTQSTWADFKNLGKQGLLVVATHGSTGAIMITAGASESALQNFVGSTWPEPGLQIRQSGLYPSNPYLLIADASWISSNWKDDRDGARSIGLFMSCKSAAEPESGPSVINAAGGAEAFGYTWCCVPADHAHDIALLLGQRMNSIAYRPAGIAINAGGYTDRMSSCDMFGESPSHSHRFVRSPGGFYWTTLNPTPFVVADASAIDSSSGNCVGYFGVHLDTQRDTSVSPAQVLTVTGGDGQIVSGPYNAQPSWGIECEYLLHPGESLNMRLDNSKVVGDGSTKKLQLPAPLTSNVSN